LEAVRALSCFLDSLVHQTVGADPVAFARHRLFITNALLAGMVGVLAVPVFLAIGGRPDGLALLVFAWLAAQAPIGLFLSRSGNLNAAHLLNAFALTIMVVIVSLRSGGANSPALVALMLIPAEAALHGSRRIIASAFAISFAGLGLILVLPQIGLPLVASSSIFAGVFAAAMIYGTILAIRAQSLSRISQQIAKSSDGKYRLVAENMSDIVLLVDRHGSVLETTPSTEKILGLVSGSLTGGGLFRRVHVGDRPTFLKALCDAHSAQELAKTDFRLRVGGKEAAAVDHAWMEMRCMPVADDDGVPGEKLVVVLRNISDRKRQEEQLLDAREDAEKANHAKTRFLANISHELRTPLNAIIGFSELLRCPELGDLGEERRDEYIGLIHESGEHLLLLVNDILDMSKIESGKFDIVADAFDLPALLRACGQMMMTQAQDAQVKLLCRPDPRIDELVADSRACRQIMINLLSNAIKFSKAGDQVEFGSRLTDLDHVFYVKDTGIGIDRADIPLLGTPFFQADSGYDKHRDGTGLGLSMVKGLTELHGGKLHVDSDLGNGTTVEVRLPIKGDLVALREAKSKPALNDHGSEEMGNQKRAGVGS